MSYFIESLKKTHEKWNEALTEFNIDKIMSFIAEEAIFYGPDTLPILGKQAIRENYQAYGDIELLEYNETVHKIEVSESGDLGYVLLRINPHRLKFGNEVYVSDYKGVTIWKKNDDHWKVLVDCYNRNPRPE